MVINGVTKFLKLIAFKKFVKCLSLITEIKTAKKVKLK